MGFCVVRCYEKSALGRAPVAHSHTTTPQILAKAEFLNPGGSVKDRVALSILQAASASGALPCTGGCIVEGTSGSTGVSLALLAPLFGARTAIWMPDDAAEEKSAAVSEGFSLV